MKQKRTATIQPHHGEPFEAIVIGERHKPAHEYRIRYMTLLKTWDTTWVRAQQVVRLDGDHRA